MKPPVQPCSQDRKEKVLGTKLHLALQYLELLPDPLVLTFDVKPRTLRGIQISAKSRWFKRRFALRHFLKLICDFVVFVGGILNRDQYHFRFAW